jgi:C4-dicarboxylate-specific signal transduction histidine kinase
VNSALIEWDSRPATLAMLTDITELRRSEEQMNQLRSELIHTTRRETMGELSSAIAHELNQPLAAIMSNTQAAQRFLNKKPPSLDKVKLALSNILRNDRRAGDIIKKLRMLLKKDTSELTEIDINDLLEEVVVLSRSSFIIKHVSIKMNLGENIPLVSGDRIQLQQVLINLILNALDSYENTTKDTKQIVITTRFENKKEVCLSVKDFGCGIEESVLNKIFDPFVTTKKEGMGMGLAINKTIIDAHRGRIWAENDPEGGATFNIILPLNKKK